MIPVTMENYFHSSREAGVYFLPKAVEIRSISPLHPKKPPKPPNLRKKINRASAQAWFGRCIAKKKMNTWMMMTDLPLIADENQSAASIAPIEALVQQAHLHIAESDCPVLILGEPGAGKRTMAAWIHARSKRCRRRLP